MADVRESSLWQHHLPCTMPSRALSFVCIAPFIKIWSLYYLHLFLDLIHAARVIMLIVFMPYKDITLIRMMAGRIKRLAQHAAAKARAPLIRKILLPIATTITFGRKWSIQG